MSDVSKQTEKIFTDLLHEPGIKITDLKVQARREILDTLVSLLHLASQKSNTAKSTRLQQRWVTIFGYLAQVSTRIVRDLEYESLRSELDELKKEVLPKNGIRLRRTIYAPRNGGREAILPKHEPRGDSH